MVRLGQFAKSQVKLGLSSQVKLSHFGPFEFESKLSPCKQNGFNQSKSIPVCFMQQKDLEEKYRNWLLLNLRVSQFLYVSDQLFCQKQSYHLKPSQFLQVSQSQCLSKKHTGIHLVSGNSAAWPILNQVNSCTFLHEFMI